MNEPDREALLDEMDGLKAAIMNLHEKHMPTNNNPKLHLVLGGVLVAIAVDHVKAAGLNPKTWLEDILKDI